MKSEKQFADIVCRAWNELDASLLEPILSDDFEYISVWVLETLKGKERYMEYIAGKFDALRKGDNPVTAEVVYQGYINKYVVVLNQGCEQVALEPAIEGSKLKSLWMRPLDLMLPAVFTTQKPVGDTSHKDSAADVTAVFTSQKHAGGTTIKPEGINNNSPWDDEEWVEKNFGNDLKKLEECGKPKLLKEDANTCPCCGYKLKPVHWGEITPEIIEKKRKREVYIGEELYGRDTGIDYQKKYNLTLFVHNVIEHPDYACGNCGESFYRVKN